RPPHAGPSAGRPPRLAAPARSPVDRGRPDRRQARPPTPGSVGLHTPEARAEWLGPVPRPATARPLLFHVRAGGDEMADHVHTLSEGGGGTLASLFEVFTPRRQCMSFEADVIWTHFLSDLFIALAYCSIPIALVVFVRRRRDLAFNWMFLLFAL